MSCGGIGRFPDFKNFVSIAFSYRSILSSRAFTRSVWSRRLLCSLMEASVVIFSWDSIASTRFWRSAMTLSLESSVDSRPFRYCYIMYSFVDSLPNCLVCMVRCWDIMAYCSLCCCYCFVYSSYTVRYASVILFVRLEDFFML